MSRWLAFGPDLRGLDLGEIAPEDRVEAAGPELAAAVAEMVRPGIEGILIAGGDPELHHAVDGALRAGLEDAAFPPLHAWFPDDPFADPDRRVKLKIGLAPRPSMSLATTVGLSTRSSMATPTVWGALDLGLVRLFAEGLAPLETVLVAGMRAGLDLEEQRRFRGLPPIEIQVTAEARNARRIDGELSTWQRTVGASLIAVMNSQHLGSLRPAPRAVPHDGLMDVLVGQGDQRDAEAWVRRMPRGEHVPDPQVVELLAASVEVRFERKLNLILDGESYRVEGFSVEVLRSPIALKV